ncbi:MmcQ/YjbR family DNA-binding protein [Devosia algicola]|uniref:MmcQ/YjbR family DNA-binding protein n=1 Tax=Devosia algicola TaxID=3026418 RepID=A0ABY7YQ51_9HYPH|nr:MmcQ/YjbR family DNA-binding protein [Devosia algicola]WDR03416.1 MmcQ/YjbR family DNA-binding protein [Devosia algicola]
MSPLERAYRQPALKVSKATFASLKDANTLVLQCPEEQKILLLEIAPDIYYETDHYVGWPAVLVRLDVISDDELALRLEDAWRHKAPAQIAAKRPTRPPKRD